jgi:hypothetical protein
MLSTKKSIGVPERIETIWIGCLVGEEAQVPSKQFTLCQHSSESRYNQTSRVKEGRLISTVYGLRGKLY